MLWTLRTLLTQKMVTIAELFKYYNCNQRRERISSSALQDQFVLGLRNTAAQQKLLSGEDRAKDKKIIFKLAVEVASAMETVKIDVRELNARKDGPVLNVQSKSLACFCCGRGGHTHRECRFQGASHFPIFISDDSDFEPEQKEAKQDGSDSSFELPEIPNCSSLVCRPTVTHTHP
uniref:CCHC-type domain-containing protein n=1 Tax=Amphimedon queenslandica TaxID=400682 RepID=A0A1X7VXI5_AMPQE